MKRVDKPIARSDLILRIKGILSSASVDMAPARKRRLWEACEANGIPKWRELSNDNAPSDEQLRNCYNELQRLR